MKKYILLVCIVIIVTQFLGCILFGRNQLIEQIHQNYITLLEGDSTNTFDGFNSLTISYCVLEEDLIEKVVPTVEEVPIAKEDDIAPSDPEGGYEMDHAKQAPLSQKHQLQLVNQLNKQYRQISFIKKRSDFKEKVYNEGALSYSLCIEPHFLFFSSVDEALNKREFGVGWQTTYVWVLYKWIKIKVVGNGIS